MQAGPYVDYVRSANPSSYNAVGSTEMARPEGPQSEAQKLELLGRGCSPPNQVEIWRSAV